jgi:hypothetical protein
MRSDILEDPYSLPENERKPCSDVASATSNNKPDVWTRLARLAGRHLRFIGPGLIASLVSAVAVLCHARLTLEISELHISTRATGLQISRPGRSLAIAIFSSFYCLVLSPSCSRYSLFALA